MKMVVAIIRHEKLQEVQDVLDECGVSGVTVTEVKGCGAQRGYTEHYRGTAVNISLRPRLKIEAVMQSEIVDKVVEMLAVAARTGETGEVGDGKIFVINVEKAVRIRTGEQGPETVQHAERAMWGH
jgi:nitrogen regulatory protein P-II 1